MALFSEVFKEGLIRSMLCSGLPGFWFCFASRARSIGNIIMRGFSYEP